jgi:hypothetical protein
MLNKFHKDVAGTRIGTNGYKQTKELVGEKNLIAACAKSR